MEKLISKIKEEEELERRYEKMMPVILKTIEKKGLEQVFGSIIQIILKNNAKKGYTRHISFNIKNCAEASGMDRERLVEQLEELDRYVFCSPDGDVLSWGEFELTGDIATVVIDAKFLEVFMRAIADETLHKAFKEKANV